MCFSISAQKWIAIAFLIISFWCCRPAPAIAAAQQLSPKPEETFKTCRVGVYVVGLRDFDMVKDSFTSDFWLWAVCPNKDLKPFDSLELVNAREVKMAYDSVLERQDKFGQFRNQDKVYWYQKKVSAQFSHKWDSRNFPFDRHTLEIPIEEALYDTTIFTYTPDLKNSSYKKDLQLEGWKIKGFDIRAAKENYNTTFGDPNINQAQSSFSRLLVSIDIQRTTLTSFFKLNAVVYIGFVLSLVTYFLDIAQTSFLGSRISASVGSLFAIVVNQRAAESVLGRSEGLTLTDQIHIGAMAYILFSVIISIYARILVERKQEKKAVRLNLVSAYFAAISFIALNIALIAHAAIAG